MRTNNQKEIKLSRKSTNKEIATKELEFNKMREKILLLNTILLAIEKNKEGGKV